MCVSRDAFAMPHYTYVEIYLTKESGISYTEIYIGPTVDNNSSGARWNMKRTRFTLLLPLCAVLVTAALWHRARSEFSSSSLDVPIPLQVAGMLNGPVAVLASPCYAFSHGDVTAWRLAVLLLAVAFQWAYIGRRI